MSESGDPAGPRAMVLAQYEQLARVARAMGSPSRLRLLDLLHQAPRSVETLAAEAHLTVANTSQHLKELKAAYLVSSEKQGQRVVYRLQGPEVAALVGGVRALAESTSPEMDRIRSELGVLDEAERSALLARIGRRKVTLLDVRPAEEHAAFHVDGAISIPLAELPARLDELPRGREVVAYCRGPYCSLALEAVAVLRTAGYRACHLDLDAPSAARRLHGGDDEEAAEDVDAGARARERRRRERRAAR